MDQKLAYSPNSMFTAFDASPLITTRQPQRKTYRWFCNRFYGITSTASILKNGIVENATERQANAASQIYTGSSSGSPDPQQNGPVNVSQKLHKYIPILKAKELSQANKQQQEGQGDGILLSAESPQKTPSSTAISPGAGRGKVKKLKALTPEPFGSKKLAGNKKAKAMQVRSALKGTTARDQNAEVGIAPLPSFETEKSGCSLSSPARDFTPASSGTHAQGFRSPSLPPILRREVPETSPEGSSPERSMRPTVTIPGSSQPIKSEFVSFRPSKRRETYLHLMRPEEAQSPKHAFREIEAFDDEVEEKKAFCDFLTQHRPRTIPNMVIKCFRHGLCEDVNIIQQLRKVPLRMIETAVDEAFQSARCLSFNLFCQLLNKLLGVNEFLRVDAQNLFAFFDSDQDDDVDIKEVCNGFILILSADASLVSVLHRCKTLVHPHNIKDTRLTFMSRFELVMMMEAVKSVVPATFDKKALSASIDKLLTSFNTDKKGEFPMEDIRDFITRSGTIVAAIDSFTVPREPNLYKSFLSQFFRDLDAEEGQQAFVSMKAVGRIKESQRLRSREGDKRMEYPANYIQKEVQEPGSPKYFTFKDILYKQEEGKPPESIWMPGMPSGKPPENEGAAQGKPPPKQVQVTTPKSGDSD